MVKNLNQSERYNSRINVINKEQWIQHYRMLRYCENGIADMEHQTPDYKETVDSITLGELQQVLKSLKNRKTCDPGGINIERIKYGGTPVSYTHLSVSEGAVLPILSPFCS